MKHIKTGFKIVLTLAIFTGIFFGVRWLIRVRNTAVAALQLQQVTVKFLTSTFPKEVEAFEAANTPAK